MCLLCTSAFILWISYMVDIEEAMVISSCAPSHFQFVSGKMKLFLLLSLFVVAIVAEQRMDAQAPESLHGQTSTAETDIVTGMNCLCGCSSCQAVFCHCGCIPC